MVTAALVVPDSALESARELLGSTRMALEAAGQGEASDVGAALRAGRSGEPVLFVPPGVRIAAGLACILVSHEGSPDVAPGLKAARELAQGSGARIVVLHVPAAQVPRRPGSLPAPRFADRPHHEWREWRREFERRFLAHVSDCRCALEVAIGQPARVLVREARRLPADLIVTTWKADASAGHAKTLRAVLEETPCPVLVVVESEP